MRGGRLVGRICGGSGISRSFELVLAGLERTCCGRRGLTSVLVRRMLVEVLCLRRRGRVFVVVLRPRVDVLIRREAWLWIGGG